MDRMIESGSLGSEWLAHQFQTVTSVNPALGAKVAIFITPTTHLIAEAYEVTVLICKSN